MNMPSEISEQVWMELDEFVAAFERAWEADLAPQIAEYLPDREHPQYHDTLVELIRVDLELCWQRGCAKSLDDYRREFPELLEKTASFNLIAFEEYRARRQAGELVAADEYANRFGLAIETWPKVSVPNGSATGKAAKPDWDWSTKDQLSLSGVAFPKAGSELLDFRLQCELGRGTWSRVYLARQGDLANRLVVLKVSAESFAEADKLAQLQHAHIVPIYSVHQAGRLTAVCMPFFGSTTLADVARDIHNKSSLPPSGRAIVATLSERGRRTKLHPGRDIPPLVAAQEQSRSEFVAAHAREGVNSGNQCYEGSLRTLSGLNYVDAVLWIGAKLADGLSHAHERGIMHRDLKPANVLLADDGSPMLLDFNLSSDLKPGAQDRETPVGGTLPYMPPEQIEAFQRKIAGGDPRGDIYSLGIILFELLTGRHPFPVHNGCRELILTQMRQDRLQPPPRLRRLNPDATPAVEAIVRRCLEPDPRRRYQTASQLHEDLERHLKQLPLRHTREPSLRERLQKWTRRHSRLTSVLAITVVIFGIAMAVGEYQENRRIADAERDIVRLMKSGQVALENGEPDVAHGRFLAAWMKVQAEPALMEYQLGVAGWLDHSRRAGIEQQWIQRVPPRDYDERRDEALLSSLLLEPEPDRSIPVARAEIRKVIDLTIPGDPGWTSEREQLTLIETDLIALESGVEPALRHLDDSSEFASRPFHECRAELLARLGRQVEADQTQETAIQFPPQAATSLFLRGMQHVRNKKFEIALQEFEQVLDLRPELFAARLFQAVCCLRLNRPGEAKVALTACLAQRPHCLWSCLYRGQANFALGDRRAARVDLERVLAASPAAPLARAARQQLRLVDAESLDPLLENSIDSR
jgi:serine/threonine protein kinase